MQELLSTAVLAARVTELGQQIALDYAGRPLTIIGVLHGSVIFVADLMRCITIPHRLGFVKASSYRGASTLPEELRIDASLLPDLTGRDVLLVDDILDTGRTLTALTAHLHECGVSSLRTMVLLWKRERTETAIAPDYFGFEIPDAFVVGYGLDYQDDYRHLPFLGVLDPAAPISQEHT